MLSLYTIGHSDLSSDRFLSLLNGNHIHTLIDVRSSPYSKFVPHFNKRELEAYIKENGLNYRFAGESLGGRPPQADVYKDQHMPEKSMKREDFLELVEYEEVMKRDWYLKGIRRLLDLIKAGEPTGENVAVMCSEGDPRECHRHHLIARSLIDPLMKVIPDEIDIIHILKDGTSEKVLASMFEQLPRQQRLF